MKVSLKQLRMFIKESMQEADVPGASCPIETQDKNENSKNKQRAMNDPKIAYGPGAGKELCGTCAAFDISPRMGKCMGPSSVNQGLGYCWMHDFMCMAKNTCRTYAAGGPIKNDKVSIQKQNS